MLLCWIEVTQGTKSMFSPPQHDYRLIHYHTRKAPTDRSSLPIRHLFSPPPATSWYSFVVWQQQKSINDTQCQCGNWIEITRTSRWVYIKYTQSSSVVRLHYYHYNHHHHHRRRVVVSTNNSSDLANQNCCFYRWRHHFPGNTKHTITEVCKFCLIVFVSSFARCDGNG